MAKTVGPVWIVQPEDTPPPQEPGTPAHPIVLPPDGIWGPTDPRPNPPIVIPPDPPLTIWGPTDPRPTPPINLPGDPDVPGDVFPGHPIYIPDDVYPDNSLPEGLQNAGSPDFYQRKTLGINWDENFDKAQMVAIYAGTADAEPVKVRTVANNGASSVTYPQDFSGEVVIRVAGMDNYLEGTTTVQ